MIDHPLDHHGSESVDRLLDQVVGWASGHGRIRAVILIGSHARGQAKADSDIDLLLLVEDPPAMIDDQGWISTFGTLKRSRTERWGEVTSVRAWYRAGWEVEFAIAAPDWARLPLDEGTARVLQDGYRTLFDPQGLFSEIARDLPKRTT